MEAENDRLMVDENDEEGSVLVMLESDELISAAQLARQGLADDVEVAEPHFGEVDFHEVGFLLQGEQTPEVRGSEEEGVK